MSEEKGLKILKAEIKNFKNISYREVEFEGRSAVIVGPNGSGKSSLIQAVCSPINSKMLPAEPVKQGEEKAEVILTIGGELYGEDVEYKIGCYFSQENKRGKIVLRNSEGTEISDGKTNLSQIIGNISFDIMEFMRLAKTESGKLSEAGVKKQIELVKSLIPKDTLSKIHRLETEYHTKYEERTEINREIKYMKSNINANRFSVEDIEKYKEELDASDLRLKIDQAKEKNAIINKCKNYISTYENDAREIAESVKVILSDYLLYDEEGTVISALSALHYNKLKQVEKYVANNDLVDIDVLIEQLNNLSEHNIKCSQIKQLQEQEKNLREKESLAGKITKRLEKINIEKLELFQSGELPVKGLSFNDECVTYNGLPLTEEQHPTSRLIAIGLEIGMALNPNLRLLVIKDGSLLDEKSMKYILKSCEQKGYQLLIEMVSTSGDDVNIEFVEK
jgi:DNA repair ATPase RecN